MQIREVTGVFPTRKYMYTAALRAGIRKRGAFRSTGPPCFQALVVGDCDGRPVELRQLDGELLVVCLRPVLKDRERYRLSELQ
jgi:hypothetical protein